ncbi:cation-translocating P-type ATPase [Paraclostridium ghonii]|uniref:Ca2+-transporting ATPase n=1 Tax=Paraclostridium ghonii TaxID=29358 RepID=A0ABU0MZ70_9FIRM|nr:cation-translocating P-type ATPase [Paeniclostridium ghonii]MDQ0556213.1 Ca2+-transporting ATPase [Paeniclostridium ghonii]
MFYKKSVEETLSQVNSSLKGLSSTKAKELLNNYGPNELKEKAKVPIWKLFLETFKDPLVIILLIAALVQIFLGEGMESSIIFAVLILNSILSVVQTKKAESSLQSLKKLSVPNAKVIRDNKKITANSKDIVPGDIIILEAGDYVPADGRVIESQTLKVVEGMLTGEAEPVLKHNNVIIKDSALGDQKNMVFSGSMVVYGRGMYVVTQTSMNTEMGKIADLLENAENKQTPLQIKLDDFSKKLGVGIVILAAFIFLIDVLRGAKLIDSFMFAVAIAVAAIPEALSSIVTIVLAVGTNIMAKRQAIVRKLPAVETLGSTSVICTDKTGTLTQNKMTVVDTYIYNPERVLAYNDSLEVAAAKMLSKQEEFIILCSSLCNDSDVTSEGIEIGDPTEIALINYANKKGFDYKKIRNENIRISELPFDSDRKRMTTVHKVDEGVVMFTKGAPDVILSRCKYALVGDEVVKINDRILNRYKRMNEEFSKKALRVLALATKRVNSEDFVPTANDEENLTLIGLTAMIDPPRKEVYEAIENAKKSGIKTVMITGDHKTTAKAIAKEIGLFNNGDIALTGHELDVLSDEELDKELEKISIYARVSPENKIRIVKAWQRKGKVCAMTGDGVNDAPALKQADIGIGMGSGTEVAKDASDMILVDDNFATIVNAIEVGRTVYTNIKKSIMYLFSGNLGGIIAILFAVIASLPNPFTTIQLLFINLVTDSLPAIALGVENPEKGVMNNPPRDKDEKILTKDTIGFVLTRGYIIGAVTIMAQLIGLRYSDELGVAMAFATLTLSRIMQTFASRSNTQSIFELGFTSNKYVLGAVCICLTMFMSTLLPFMREIFNIPYSFNLNILLVCFGLATLSTLSMETSEILRRKYNK